MESPRVSANFIVLAYILYLKMHRTETISLLIVLISVQGNFEAYRKSLFCWSSIFIKYRRFAILQLFLNCKLFRRKIQSVESAITPDPDIIVLQDTRWRYIWQYFPSHWWMTFSNSQEKCRLVYNKCLQLVFNQSATSLQRVQGITDTVSASVYNRPESYSVDPQCWNSKRDTRPDGTRKEVCCF